MNNMKKIIVVTGGQRSGKSSFAQRLALELSENPVYLATSAVWDEEHRERIERHKRDRGAEWTNIEEQFDVDKVDVNGRVVLLDCVTLWATNFFSKNDAPIRETSKRSVHTRVSGVLIITQINVVTVKIKRPIISISFSPNFLSAKSPSSYGKMTSGTSAIGKIIVRYVVRGTPSVERYNGE